MPAQAQIIGKIHLAGMKVAPDKLNLFYPQMKAGRIAGNTGAINGACRSATDDVKGNGTGAGVVLSYSFEHSNLVGSPGAAAGQQ